MQSLELQRCTLTSQRAFQSTHRVLSVGWVSRAPHLTACTLPGIENTSAFSLARKHPFSHAPLQTHYPQGGGRWTDSGHFAPPHHKPAQSNYPALLQLGTHCSLIYSSRAPRAAGGWPRGRGTGREKPKPHDSGGNADTGDHAARSPCLPTPCLHPLKKLIPIVKSWSTACISGQIIRGGRYK